MNHTKEPWSYAEMDNDKVEPSFRIFGKRKTVVNGKQLSDKLCIGRLDTTRDASRAVACVNACAGIENPEWAVFKAKAALAIVADSLKDSARGTEQWKNLQEVKYALSQFGEKV